tara:strand:+ start:1061 stop:1492 length:432 start_codon:yes stop_codon:yes gene_type:complete
MLPNDKLNKGARIYVDSALSAATHPVRKNILKLLKKRSLSTIDIESSTKESRYNLYHHLNVLENSGLIKVDNKKSEGKLKFYQMNYPKKPIMAAFNFDKSDIKEKNNLCNKLYKTIEKIEDYDLPNTNKICKIEVYLTYDWNK